MHHRWLFSPPPPKCDIYRMLKARLSYIYYIRFCSQGSLPFQTSSKPLTQFEFIVAGSMFYLTGYQLADCNQWNFQAVFQNFQWTRVERVFLSLLRVHSWKFCDSHFCQNPTKVFLFSFSYPRKTQISWLYYSHRIHNKSTSRRISVPLFLDLEKSCKTFRHLFILQFVKSPPPGIIWSQPLFVSSPSTLLSSPTFGKHPIFLQSKSHLSSQHNNCLSLETRGSFFTCLYILYKTINEFYHFQYLNLDYTHTFSTTLQSDSLP